MLIFLNMIQIQKHTIVWLFSSSQFSSITVLKLKNESDSEMYLIQLLSSSTEVSYSVKVTSRFVLFSSERVIAIKLILLLSIVVFQSQTKQATRLQRQGPQTVFWLDKQFNSSLFCSLFHTYKLEHYTSHM